uniref:Serine peptidase inhibitor, Kunitz type 1 a n=1 Tax=Nothobranchius kadleci TaxID=1051664 RepID=A0A1A8C985_NOTKA
MNLFIRSPPALLLLVVLVESSTGQDLEQCLDKFKKGKEDFILDLEESVKDGAVILSVPKLERYRDCVTSCCKDPMCNVAFMEKGDQEGQIKSCFLFNCVVKKNYVCRFVKTLGYSSYVLNTVYDTYFTQESSSKNSPDSPPVADAGPDLVVQPKEIVTLNGFRSKDDKEIVSYNWLMITEYPSAVIEKSNFKDEIRVSNLTSGKYKFQLTVTDASGQSDVTTITVLVLTPELSEHHCMAPKKVGPCRGSFPRWHYNAASGKCESFNFGGCKENLNNYLSEDECSKACTGAGSHSGRILHVSQEEKCGAPCSTFEFACDNGCCLAPGLECDHTPQCSDGSDESKCEFLENKFRKLMEVPVDERKVHCTENPNTGACRDSQTKWYYDPVSRECHRFNYGGCGGNENKFDNQESCQKVCSGVTEKDVFERKEVNERLESESQTGIFWIAIVLGVAILILLGLLGYCFMKNRKSSHHQPMPVTNTLPTYDNKQHMVY